MNKNIFTDVKQDQFIDPQINFCQETLANRDPGTAYSFSEADWDRMADIYALSFTGMPWFEDWNREQARKTFAEYLARGADFVASYSSSDVKNQGTIPVAMGIGLALSEYSGSNELIALGISPQAYYIAELCTAPEARRLGYGGKILEQLISGSSRLNCPEIVARTREDNYDMIRILVKADFIECGKYLAETGGLSSTRVVYRKLLN